MIYLASNMLSMYEVIIDLQYHKEVFYGYIDKQKKIFVYVISNWFNF